MSINQNNFDGLEDIKIHTYNCTPVAPTLDNKMKRNLSIRKRDGAAIGETIGLLM